MSDQTNISTFNVNRAIGMLYGHHLGDALGAPHEFVKTPYTGRLDQPVRVKTKWIDVSHASGCITDDTCMTYCLLTSILENGGEYNKDSVLSAYMDWCCNWKRGVGVNTRSLLKFKQVETYERKWKERFDTEEKRELCQSNGSLMRASPLALLSDRPRRSKRCPTRIDCCLTNPSTVNCDASRLYVTILWMLIRDHDRKDVISHIKGMKLCQEVREVMEEALRGENRDTVTNRGWILHALYFAVKTLKYAKNFESTMDAIAHLPRTDSDTNAAVSGAVIGAIFGYEKMIESETTKWNIRKMTHSSDNSDYIYKPKTLKKKLRKIL